MDEDFTNFFFDGVFEHNEFEQETDFGLGVPRSEFDLVEWLEEPATTELTIPIDQIGVSRPTISSDHQESNGAKKTGEELSNKVS